MQIDTDKKLQNIKKRIMRLLIGVMMVNLIFLSSVSMAQDYPSSYLGSGYREYLQDKIRDGYKVEIFTDLENRQKQMVNKKNQIREIVSTSYQANSASAYEILEAGSQRTRNIRKITQTVRQNQNQAKEVAYAQTEFTYVKHSDGKTVYFTDGLPTTIKNERVVDEFGNVSIKNTWNMQYDKDTRLLTGYEANLTDNLGNSTYIYAYGIKHTPDSVFYADDDTIANKNEMEKYIKEIDSAGNVKLTRWQALSYDGKLLRAFSQEIEDSLYGKNSFTRTNITYEDNNYKRASAYRQEGIGTDGLLYSLDRTNIAYNDKDLVSDYHEETVTTQIDGGTIRTINDAQFTYLSVPHQFGSDIEEPDPDKLLQSIITTTTINLDGSEKTETATTTYDYDAEQKLIGASANTAFTGQEADWLQYSDKSGHTLSRDESNIGNVTYTYIDPDTQETVIVPHEEVTATLKQGNKYIGTAKIQYEIFENTPMTSREDSNTHYYNAETRDHTRTDISTFTYTNGLVNNLLRVFDIQEHTERTDHAEVDERGNPQITTKDVTTDYIYAKNGNLRDAQGLGSAKGYEFTNDGWMEYTSDIEVDYEVILGQAKQKSYQDLKDYEL